MSEHTPGTYRDPARFADDIARFERDAKTQPKGAVVGYGSSTIRLWGENLKRDFAPLTMINRGFGGSNANDGMVFADRVVLPLRPRAILLYFGGNDLEADGMEPEQVMEKILHLFKRVGSALPQVRWYHLSLKLAPSRPDCREKTLAFNRQLHELCEGSDRHVYLDVTTPMLDADGQPREELFAQDRLHLSKAGYALWLEVARPVLMRRERMFEPVG